MALFFRGSLSYKGLMNETHGRGPKIQTMLNDENGGPWGGRGGGSGSGGGDGDGDGLGPRNPWSQPPRKRPQRGAPGPSVLDKLLHEGRERFGGRMPRPDARPIWLWAIAAFALLWVALTSVHQVDSQERGVLTRFGKYAGTLAPGISITFPAPIDHVRKVEVENIRIIDIGSTAANDPTLMITGDQNIIDLAYSVRWNVRDPELYVFELADPDDTIREVAESAMRSEIARVSLDDAIGSQRSQIEGRVAQRMQEILDGYRAGVAIQGVAIKQADPPAAVNDAFKEVSAAQQEAQSYLNGARAYAQQLSAKAGGEAAAFDKVYSEYKLAPEVTRRRMYYETMEKVLAKSDKTIVETPGTNSYLPLPLAKKGAGQ